jgi:hypothetical protein
MDENYPLFNAYDCLADGTALPAPTAPPGYVPK